MTETKCPNCKEEVSQVEIYCENCNFPLSGTEKEKSIFIGRQIANKSKIETAKESQGKAQKILYLVGAFQLFNAFRAYSNSLDSSSIIFYIILGSLLVLFGFLSSKKPLLFISLAFVMMLGYYAFLYSINPEYLFQGILWKIVTLGFLGYGSFGAIEEQDIKKKNKFLNKN